MTRPLAAIGLSVACAIVLLASGAAAAPTARDGAAATSAGGPAVGANDNTAYGRPNGRVGASGHAAGIGGTMGSPRSPARDIDGPTGGPNNAPVANGRPADGGPVERIGK